MQQQTLIETEKNIFYFYSKSRIIIKGTRLNVTRIVLVWIQSYALRYIFNGSSQLAQQTGILYDHRFKAGSINNEIQTELLPLFTFQNVNIKILLPMLWIGSHDPFVVVVGNLHNKNMELQILVIQPFPLNNLEFFNWQL